MAKKPETMKAAMKKWEGSPADKKMDKAKGYKEGSAADMKSDKKQARKLMGGKKDCK